MSRLTGKSNSCWWKGAPRLEFVVNHASVHPALGEHLVEERVRLERVDAGVAAGVRQRDPDVEVPELEHGHEDHERDDCHEDRVEEEARAALPLADGPLHGGTVVASVVGAASCVRTLWTLGLSPGLCIAHKPSCPPQLVLVASLNPNFDQSSGFGSVYWPSTWPSTPSSSTSPRIDGGSSAL